MSLNTKDTGGDTFSSLFSRRKSALWESPELGGIDSFLITEPVHHRYLCGFSGSNAYLLLTPAESLFFTDGRYREQSEDEIEDARVEIVEGPLRNALKGIVGPGQKIGFEAQRLTVADAEGLRSAFPQVEWRPVGDIVEQLRLCKDESEVAAIRQASEIAETVMKEIAGKLEPGRAELEIAGSVEESLRRHGSEGSAFEPIVASGLRGAMPHGKATPKKILDGECVTIDFGAVWYGYHSDLTRTFSVGDVDPEFRQWQVVLDKAINTALEIAEPGIACKELDLAARRVIDEAGLGEYFVHNLGHGIGLEVHEGPHISRSSLDSLAEGMVITIEPGVYVPGRGGMRIEENVVVTGGGPQLLTRSPRTLEPPEK